MNLTSLSNVNFFDSLKGKKENQITSALDEFMDAKEHELCDYSAELYENRADKTEEGREKRTALICRIIDASMDIKELQQFACRLADEDLNADQLIREFSLPF